ncbi:MAG: MRP family ATP-binding protein [Bacteroidetes bacterium 4484_249]|nr:MAG: MRP family ATP-binding protein [Bacteroidetes bacterium 4484_249]
MTITKEQILDALKHVDDPDLKKDLVTLNMIQNIKIEGDKVTFDLVLTTPACPLKDVMKNDCVAAIHKYVDENLKIEVKMESSVSTKRKATELMLKGVRNIIAVASGKGGVGKSTVAANLAVALAKTGAKVGLLDADIYGPSVPLMFGLEGAQPNGKEVDGKTKIIPLEKYGIKLLSIGFFVDSSQALIWRGAMATNALNQLVNDTEWGDLDYFIIDLPPGTGDIHLTMVQTLPVTGAVIVSTPQEVALADARKAFSMFAQKDINVPIIGLVENMAWFTPEELPNNKYYIFGKDGAKKLAKESNVALVGQIPIVQSIRESGDTGNPAALENNTPVAKAFLELAQNVAQQIAIRNATLEPTKIVEITTK